MADPPTISAYSLRLIKLLSRDLRADELAILKDSLAQLAAFYKDHAKEAGELIQIGEV